MRQEVYQTSYGPRRVLHLQPMLHVAHFADEVHTQQIKMHLATLEPMACSCSGAVPPIVLPMFFPCSCRLVAMHYRFDSFINSTLSAGQRANSCRQSRQETDGKELITVKENAQREWEGVQYWWLVHADGVTTLHQEGNIFIFISEDTVDVLVVDIESTTS